MFPFILLQQTIMVALLSSKISRDCNLEMEEPFCLPLRWWTEPGGGKAFGVPCCAVIGLIVVMSLASRSYAPFKCNAPNTAFYITTFYDLMETYF